MFDVGRLVDYSSLSLGSVAAHQSLLICILDGGISHW